MNQQSKVVPATTSPSASTPTTSRTNERIVINVAGMPFETWTRTLARFPKTLLGNPHKRLKYYDRANNELFFERHRQSFDAILYYYQSNGRFLIRPMNVSSEVFFDEIVFFELGKEVINKYKKDEGYFTEREINLSDLPRNKLKRYIWLLFEYPHSSMLARIVAIVSVIVITTSIALFCIETLPEVKARRAENAAIKLAKQSQSVTQSSSSSFSTTTTTKLPDIDAPPPLDEFFVVETVCIIWFSLELVLRAFAAPKKLEFVKQTGNIVDFLSILPYFMSSSELSAKFSILRIIRLVRVFRVFKLVRHFKGLQILIKTLRASANELGLLVFFLGIVVILFSSIVYFVEIDHVTTDFASIPDGFWYAIITMTTVGYGEMVPKTPLGRFIGSFCAIAGVLTIALPVPIIVSHFQFFYEGDKVLKKVNKDTLKASYKLCNEEDIQSTRSSSDNSMNQFSCSEDYFESKQNNQASCCAAGTENTNTNTSANNDVNNNQKNSGKTKSENSATSKFKAFCCFGGDK